MRGCPVYAREVADRLPERRDECAARERDIRERLFVVRTSCGGVPVARLSGYEVRVRARIRVRVGVRVRVSGGVALRL